MGQAHPAVLERIGLLRDRPEDADRLLARWAQRFGAVVDRPLRRTVLAECLSTADDGTLVALLARIEDRADAGDPTCRWMYTELALTPALVHELPYDRLIELYVAAREAGLARVAARLLTGPRVRGDAPQENPHLDRSAGERTALARTRDRLLLDRIAHDRDPRVIRAYLDNPRVTERDVVRVAAMRPTIPAILEMIAAHPRWAARYAVRKALAFNPSSPPELARHLLPTLLRQDLEVMVQSQALHPALREEVRQRLAERRAAT